MIPKASIYASRCIFQSSGIARNRAGVVFNADKLSYAQTLGSVDLLRFFLQRIVGYLYKTKPLSCGCSGQCAQDIYSCNIF